MSLESMGSRIDESPKLEKSPEYFKELNKRVKQIEKGIEYSKQLTKVNDVLNVLDFPDEQEKIYRKKLEKQNPQILEELAKKSKGEIMTFLFQEKHQELKIEKQQTQIKVEEGIKIKQVETQKQNIDNQIINKKLSKIKSVFTPEILTKHSDITNQFDFFDSYNDNEVDKKQKALDKILDYLKDDGVLKSIIADLGGASKNNPKFVEFRNTLIGLDPSFENFLPFLEDSSDSLSLNNNDVVKTIKGDLGEVTNIDLNSNPPVSKLSLIGSEYSFNTEIDKQAVDEVQEKFIKELEVFQNSKAILKGLYKPFDFLITEVRKNWGKQDLNITLKNAISTVSKDVFSKLDEAYTTMDIKADIRITESDLYSFGEVNSPTELKLKKDGIDNKLQKIDKKVSEKEKAISKNHKIEIEALALLDSKTNEKQVEILKFMNNCGFDKLPKNITNRIIKEIESGMLLIPGLSLSIKNIDLKNGHFGESGAFIDKEAGINIASKINMVKFMNKLISGNIDEPMSVDTIANGVAVIDPVKLQNQFLEAGVVGGMGWSYEKIIENLRKVN